ncbi:hypothetical protein L3X38_032926 [Prunus dulcis]|uniref:Uncharacterized protein n=1 Tax=Prunus dulcis TaxID=3755 RepID=A0AAD4VF86_PRUDU|nr:hypothetical protein L3X38_032926 [Prunus dulcis]
MSLWAGTPWGRPFWLTPKKVKGQGHHDNTWPHSIMHVTPRDQLCRSTILSALGPPSGPHGFISGSSRPTSQWVTHPGIALAPNSLNFGVPTTPKPVSSQKASC